MNLIDVLRVGSEMILFLLGWRLVQIWTAKSHPDWSGAMGFIV